MTKSGRLRSYWSGIDNIHTRATANNQGGKAVRKTLYELTDNKIFLESNFKKHNLGKKGGKAIKKSHIRSALKKIRLEKEKLLKKEWRELKKEGAPIGSFNDFRDANLKDDQEWQDVQELFNSP